MAEQRDAKKERKGRVEALALAKGADKVIVARGKKIVEFDMNSARPDDETLLAHLLGPTGNLRAPAIRNGKTLLVGFNGAIYAQILSG